MQLLIVLQHQALLHPTATDACSSATVNVVSDVTTPGACAGTYSRTITWDATDGMR
jgi:hypothetical protein